MTETETVRVPVVAAAPNGDGHAPVPATLTPTERAAGVVVVVLVGLLGVIGAVNSFEAVATAVEPSFGGLAWSVPVGIDVGIAVFTGLDLLLARLDMRMCLLRLVPWALVGVTVYLNVAGETEPVGAVAHGVLPLLWVIAVEAGAHVTRVRAGLDRPTRRSTPARNAGAVGFWRYLAIRAGTRVPGLRRTLVVLSERNYDDAVRRAQQRDLVRAELREKYGRVAWQWKTPATKRVLYRWGGLAPSRALLAGLEGASTSPPGQGAGSPGGASPRRQETAPKRGRANGARVADTERLAHLLPMARQIREDYAARGQKLTCRALLDSMRAADVKIANKDGGPLLAALEAEGRSR